MSHLDELRARFDRLAAQPNPPLTRLSALATQIEVEQRKQRRADRIASTAGPNRSHALVQTDHGVQRVQITRVVHQCPSIDPGSKHHRVTLEFLGSDERSSECPSCGRAQWREKPK